MKRSEKGIGKRRMAREMAAQMLYQVDLGSCSPREAFAVFDLGEYLAGSSKERPAAGTDAPEARPRNRLEQAREAFSQACRMVEGAREHLDEIDSRIRAQAEHWRLERMPAVDRNILRLATWEMLYDSEVPKLVVLDEAVELAKRFGAEQSGRFVNGLLDGLMRGLDAPEESRP